MDLVTFADDSDSNFELLVGDEVSVVENMETAERSSTDSTTNQNERAMPDLGTTSLPAMNSTAQDQFDDPSKKCEPESLSESSTEGTLPPENQNAPTTQNMCPEAANNATNKHIFEFDNNQPKIENEWMVVEKIDGTDPRIGKLRVTVKEFDTDYCAIRSPKINYKDTFFHISLRDDDDNSEFIVGIPENDFPSQYKMQILSCEMRITMTVDPERISKNAHFSKYDDVQGSIDFPDMLNDTNLAFDIEIEM